MHIAIEKNPDFLENSNVLGTLFLARWLESFRGVRKKWFRSTVSNVIGSPQGAGAVHPNL